MMHYNLLLLLHVLSLQHITDPHNMEQSMDVALNNPLSQEDDVSISIMTFVQYVI